MKIDTLIKATVAGYDIEVHGQHPSPKEIYHPRTQPGYRAPMEIGLLIDLFGDYDSRIFHFKAR